MIQPVREGQSSLECCCYNCRYGVKRSDYHLEYGAWAYDYMCYLDEYSDDLQLCYQSTHVCKKWRGKKNDSSN